MIREGYNGVIRFKIGGVAAAGAWAELTNIKDVTFSLEAAEADATSRGSGGWKQDVPTIRSASVEFQMIWDNANPVFAAFAAAFTAQTHAEKVIGLQVFSEDGGDGLQADFAIFQFSRNEELAELMTADVVMKPTYSLTAPAWVTP